MLTNKKKKLKPIVHREPNPIYGQISKADHLRMKRKQNEIDAEVEAFRQEVIEKKEAQEVAALTTKVPEVDIPAKEEVVPEAPATAPTSALKGKKKRAKSK